MGFLENAGVFLRTGAWPFESSAAAIEARAGSASVPQFSQFETMAPSWSQHDTELFVREAYRKNALAYRCIEFVANAVSQPILTAMREGKGGAPEELPPLDPLACLLERPSADYKSQTRFVKAVIVSLLSRGEAIFFKAPGERSGQVVDLQALPPSKVSVDNSRGRKEYLYHYDPARAPIRLREEEVIFCKLDDPDNKDRGLAPLSAAAREIDVDNSGADMRKAFLDNGAVLAGILTTKADVPMPNELELEEMRQRWQRAYGGAKRAGQTPFLGGLEYQEIGTSPDKIAFPEVIGISEARICSAFGVEPILVGAKIGLDRSTYSNYETAEKAFWKNTVPAFLTFLEDEFTAGLTERGDGRMCVFDTDGVPALQEDADKKEQRYGRMLRNGSATINEYREAAGLEPVEDGALYMLPGGVTLVPEGELDVDRTPPQLQEGDDEPEEDPDEEDPGGDAPQDDPGGQQGGSSGAGDEEGRQRHEEAHRELRYQKREAGKLERRLARAIEDVFGVQAEAVAERVADTLDPDELLDLTIEAERMAEAVTPHIRAILTEEGEATAKDDFDLEDEGVRDYLDAAPLVLGFAMARRTRDLIASGIADVQAEKPDGSWTTDEIAERLREIVVDRDRANLAAETETVRTANRAARFALKQNGVVTLRRRATSEEPCEFCRALDGREVSVDDPFAALGEEIEGADGGTMEVTYEDMYDSTHPRCSCVVEPA